MRFGLDIVAGNLRGLELALDLCLGIDGGLAIELRLAAAGREVATFELYESLAVTLLDLQRLVGKGTDLFGYHLYLLALDVLDLGAHEHLLADEYHRAAGGEGRVGLAVFFHIHGLHGNGLGIDVDAAGGLAFGIGGGKIHLLGTDRHLTFSRKCLLLLLAVLQVVVDALNSDGLRAEDEVALSGIVRLRERTCVVDLDVGRGFGADLDGLGAELDAAVGGECLLLAFLLGHLVVDTLDGDVLRTQREVAVGGIGGCSQLTLLILLVGLAARGHLDVHGLDVDLAFLLQLSFLFNGGNADIIGHDRDARALVVAQIALTVGRDEANVLARDRHGGACGLLLEVIALDDGVLLGLVALHQTIGLRELREDVTIVIDITGDARRHLTDLTVEFPDVGCIGTDGGIVLGKLLLFLDELFNLLDGFLEAFLLFAGLLFEGGLHGLGILHRIVE